MNLPHLALAAASLTFALIGATMVIRRRARRFLGSAWLALGVALALAAFKPGLFEGVAPASLLMRMRLALGLLSFVVLMITLEAVRRFAMEERYALLWVSTGVILVVFAIYPETVGWLAKITGMQYVSAITMVVFAFLLLVSFHFSLALSEVRMDQKRLCQHAAELALKVTKLEQRLAELDPARKT